MIRNYIPLLAALQFQAAHAIPVLSMNEVDDYFFNEYDQDLIDLSMFDQIDSSYFGDYDMGEDELFDPQLFDLNDLMSF